MSAFIVIVYSEIQSMTIVNIADCVPRVLYITYEESDNTIHMNMQNIMMIDDLHTCTDL